MSAFIARCRHCHTIVKLEPAQHIMLFAGEGVSDSFFNYRCNHCEGINHHNVQNTPTFKEVVLWFGAAGNLPQVVPASHRDSEIAEICELEHIGFKPINTDDLLDLILDLRTHEAQAIDLRDLVMAEAVCA